MKRKRPEGEKLRQLYVEEGKTDQWIAEKYGVSSTAVRKWRSKYQINTLTPGERRSQQGFPTLDPEEIGRAYQEGATAKAIAEKYGVSKPVIRNVLRDLGISAMKKWERNTLGKRFSDRHHAVVVGTLLGDATIGHEEKGEGSRLKITHSHAQYHYMRSLCSELGSWVSSMTPTVTINNGRRFFGYTLRTFYHPKFREYRNRFYRDDLRGRYPHDWLKNPPMYVYRQLSDVSLAYWYLDDGTLSLDGGEVSLACFFPLSDPEEIAGAVSEGTRLRWSPRSPWEQGRAWLLKLHQDDREEFFTRIRDVVTSDLLYKLPEAHWSHVKTSGHTIPREVLEDPESCLKHYSVPLWKEQDEGTQEKWIGEVFLLYRALGFPFPPSKSGSETLKMVELLEGREEGVEDGHSFVRSQAGLSLANSFMPHRYRTVVRGRSAWETFHDDEALLKVIRSQFESSGRWVTPRPMAAALSVYGGNRTPSNFRPSIAKAITDRLCPEGGRVWDPCAGFGGRLLGVVCSSSKPTYIGTEPSPETVKQLRTLWARVATLKGWERGRVEILEGVAEQDLPSEPVDLVLTSPPYYRVERYEGGDQSHKHKDVESWVAEFLKPMTRNAYEVLRDGGYMAINIQDVKVSGRVVPLVRLLDEAAREVGFHRFERWWMPLSRFGNQRPDEPILCYRKGSVASEVEWDLEEKQTTHGKDRSYPSKVPVRCQVCGVELPGASSKRKYCEQHKKEIEAARARERRAKKRKANPPKGTRVFTCQDCGVKWSTERKGSFPRCPACKAEREEAKKRKVCQYRHCGITFLDESPKRGMRYCCEDHRYKEKQFRLGRAKDETYFRENKPPYRTCPHCGIAFLLGDESSTGSRTCEKCHQERRRKACKECGQRFLDDSPRKTRKYCPQCR